MKRSCVYAVFLLWYRNTFYNQSFIVSFRNFLYVTRNRKSFGNAYIYVLIRKFLLALIKSPKSVESNMGIDTYVYSKICFIFLTFF